MGWRGAENCLGNTSFDIIQRNVNYLEAYQHVCLMKIMKGAKEEM